MAGYSRNPEKLAKQLAHDLDANGIPWTYRQSGSHGTFKTDRGNVVISMHGEIPKGTFFSIMRMIKNIGIPIVIVLLISSACVSPLLIYLNVIPSPV